MGDRDDVYDGEVPCEEEYDAIAAAYDQEQADFDAAFARLVDAENRMYDSLARIEEYADTPSDKTGKPETDVANLEQEYDQARADVIEAEEDLEEAFDTLINGQLEENAVRAYDKCLHPCEGNVWIDS